MRWGGSAALRWVCVLVLAAALLLTLPMRTPHRARFGQVLAGVRTGQVTRVQVHDDAGTGVSVVWHEGPLRWYRADGPYDARTQLQLAGTTAGSHGLSFTTLGSDRLWIEAVADADEPSWLVFAAGVLWGLSFIAMLAVASHPYATRWAWFWLFVVGGIGPILMWFKEPEPLPVRPGRRRRTRPSEPVNGATGLVYAVLWAFSLYLAGLGIGALTG
ncbi:hypothetical protein [Catenulispora subtropica]|uniref:DUF3592 domain-containing protein n=1 Tax=Catenulispora subtropica TaxID=450798 RepID=A0ABP5E2Q7_9ACTN